MNTVQKLVANSPSVWVVLGVLCVGCLLFVGCTQSFPPVPQAVQRFESHRADFVRFANLLRENPSATRINGDGMVFIDGVQERLAPEYRDLVKALGIMFVDVSEDGSIEFAIWGHGSAIESDSYMGIRYYPKDHRTDVRPRWTQTVVKSLDDDKLPQEHGAVAIGLYVVPVEPEWFIYRSEYQE